MKKIVLALCLLVMSSTYAAEICKLRTYPVNQGVSYYAWDAACTDKNDNIKMDGGVNSKIFALKQMADKGYKIIATESESSFLLQKD